MKIKYFPFYILSILPMPVLYILSDVLYVVSYKFVKYRRTIVQQNLLNSFPNKSQEEIDIIAKGFYKYFCDVMVESLKGLTINKHKVSQRLICKNLDLLEKYYDEGRNIILYAAHHGNWEWLSFLPIYVRHKSITLYHPLSNKYFDGLMKLLRSRFGVLCVDSKKGYRTILKYVKEGQLTISALIGDQCPTKNSSKHWVNFLNQRTPFLKGAERIIERTNNVAIFPVFKKIKRGRYELEFKEISGSNSVNKSSFFIEEYAKILEESIIQSPEMWLWSHRRWKLKEPDVVENKKPTKRILSAEVQ